MTRDEAIKIIQTEMECVSRPDCNRLECVYCDLAMREEDVLTAYEMAITALQTDGNAISRTAVLDAIRKADINGWVKDDLLGRIKALSEGGKKHDKGRSRIDTHKT